MRKMTRGRMERKTMPTEGRRLEVPASSRRFLDKRDTKTLANSLEEMAMRGQI
jgi:hypothetical protein